MGFFMPSFFQKRILRYALSRLDLFDTDALDLDRLDIAWGKNSTIELREIGLKREQLSALLNLPPYLKLSTARVLLLRLTIPADIYSSGIVVEVDGVEGEIEVSEDGQESNDRDNAGKRWRSGYGRKADRTRGLYREISGEGAERLSRSPNEGQDMISGAFPTIPNLAQSFIETESRQERAQLEAAVARSRVLPQSQSSDSSEEEVAEGIGVGLSLPGFVGDFIKGVGDRLKVTICNVQLDANVRLDLPTSPQNVDDMPVLETFTFRVIVGRLTIDEVKSDQPSSRSSDESSGKPSPLGRAITLDNIQGLLLSDPSVFTLLAHSSGPSSPTATHTSSFKDVATLDRENSLQHSSSPLAASITTTHSTTVPSEYNYHHEQAQITVPRMDASIATSDGARFADPESDDEVEQSVMGSQQSLSSERGYAEYGQFDNPHDSFLDQIEEEMPINIADSDTLPRVDISDEEEDSEVEDSFLVDIRTRPSQPYPTDPGTGHFRDGPVPIQNPRGRTERTSGSTQASLANLSVETRTHESSPRTETIDHPENVVSHPDVDALEDPEPRASRSQTPSPGSPQPTPPVNDLAESKLWTHEEAESMYMSAISQIPDTVSEEAPIPGAWNTFDSPGKSQYISPTRAIQDENSASVTGITSSLKTHGIGLSTHEQSSPSHEQQGLSQLPTISVHSTAERSTKDGTTTPDGLRSFSIPSKAEPKVDNTPRMLKTLFTIASIQVRVPEIMKQLSSQDQGSAKDPSSTSTRSQNNVPGSFSVSTLGDSTFSQMRGSTRGESSAVSTLSTSQDNSGGFPISVSVQNIFMIGDMTLTRLLIKVLQLIVSQQSKQAKRGVAVTSSTSSNVKIALSLNSFIWNFVDVVSGRIDRGGQDNSADPVPQSQTDILLSASILDLLGHYGLHNQNTKAELSIRKFKFGYADGPIISFDPAMKMRESTRDILAPVDKDIAITMNQNTTTTRIEANTLPLHINLNLAHLDETLTWFGGLSSVLGLGNSMMSTVAALDTRSKRSPAKPRNVRFETPKEHTKSTTSTATANKITLRVGGLVLDVVGKEAALSAQGTAMKIVSRVEGIGVQIDRLQLFGPVLPSSDKEYASINTIIENVRVEYVETPKENDLARLLALLSPSTDRDEVEDDILLDTLLRQRRQGGVLRLTVEKITGNIARLDELQHFNIMGEELKKLSTVTKYLPEDDRPGILTLALIHKLDFGVDTSRDLGTLRAKATNLEVAQVGVPALLLVGISTIEAFQGTTEIIGQDVAQIESRQAQNSPLPKASPMILLKYVGDEMEPTMRLKISRLRAEYHVSTIMAALGVSETASGEIIFTDMVNSMMKVTDKGRRPKLSPQTSSSSDKSNDINPLRYAISLRDTTIGLNPRNSEAKGLLVLTNANLQITPSQDRAQNLSGSLIIKKASLMVIDDIKNVNFLTNEGTSSRPSTPISSLNHVQILNSQGFVTVSEISSAKVEFRSIALDKDEGKAIEVDVRDDLIVIETCADSTQTLQTVLNGLSPPMPPSKELKYRTEIVPVEDMLRSFSGDAFPTRMESEEGSEVDENEIPLGLDEGDLMDDELPQNLEYVTSLYNGRGVTESMLDNDFDTFARPPATKNIGESQMLSSFQEQYEVDPGATSLHFDEDHFTASTTVGGTAHRWNAELNTYGLTNEAKIKESPLKIRVRDVHVIWNMFDGYDWQHTRDTITQAVTDIETKAAERLAKKGRQTHIEAEDEDESVIGDFLFNSIYIGISPNQDPRDLTRQVNRNLDDLVSEADSYATSTTVTRSPSRRGASLTRNKRKRLRLHRSRHHKMTFELKGVSVDVVVFPPGSGETQSSIDIRVQDLEIFDHVPTSTWKKFATYMHDAGERESGTSMIHIEILNVKPVPELAASELVLKATILPVRLHVDQDALEFLTRFFEFRDESAPVHPTKSEVPFLQRVEVKDVKVKLDFKPKRVDYAGLRSGHTTEFMNFFILDGADMVLRHVIIYGVSGFDKLGKTLNDIWTPDVRNNQLPGVLAGLAPVRGLVNVGGGVRDLVVVPMREYRKDGRVVRSIQMGALAFAKTTTTELAKLGAKLAIGTQTVLQQTEDFFNPMSRLNNDGSATGYESWDTMSPTGAGGVEEDAPEEKNMISPYADQPVGVAQGLRGAYRHLERDLLMARDAIVAMPGEIMESGSAKGVVKAVARGAPTIILRPALGVTKAVGQTLLGAANTLDKQERRRVEDKYKRH